MGTEQDSIEFAILLFWGMQLLSNILSNFSLFQIYAPKVSLFNTAEVVL